MAVGVAGCEESADEEGDSLLVVVQRMAFPQQHFLDYLYYSIKRECKRWEEADSKHESQKGIEII